MSITYEESASGIPIERDIEKEECKVEHCLFPWTVTFDDFLTQDKSKSHCVKSLMFSASDKKETYTLWKIGLMSLSSRRDIQIHLERLKSDNASQVFVRFHWEILDAEGNKIFPGSIHTTLSTGDTFSKELVKISTILRKRQRYLVDGNLSLLCELSVYETKIEDFISSRAKASVPYGLKVLSEDMARLLRTGTTADLSSSELSGEPYCYIPVLSARSSVFAELLKMKKLRNYNLYLCSLQEDVLHALLTYLYCGWINFYLDHTIPKKLYAEAKKHGLLHLQKHLDAVYSNKITRLKSIDVTWKIPFFNTVISQPETVFYCPAPESRTLYDDRWCFKLELKSCSDSADIFVIRRQTERSFHKIKLVVKVETFGKVTFETSEVLVFNTDGAQAMNKFLTKVELRSMLSSLDTLVLKCSLEVLECINMDQTYEQNEEQIHPLTSAVELFTCQAKESLQQLSKDLGDLFHSEMFSDARVASKCGEFRVHSCIVEARFLTPVKDLKVFIETLDQELVPCFFRFLYEGKLPMYPAAQLKLNAQNCNLPIVAQKFLDHYLVVIGSLIQERDESIDD